MNSLTVVVLCVALVAVNAGVIAPLANLHAIAAHDTPIVTPGLLAAPGLIAAPGVFAARGLLGAGLVASPVVAGAVPVVAEGSGIEGQYLHDPSGHGLDGQYVHDFTETLFDNGEYHGEIYA